MNNVTLNFSHLGPSKRNKIKRPGNKFPYTGNTQKQPSCMRKLKRLKAMSFIYLTASKFLLSVSNSCFQLQVFILSFFQKSVRLLLFYILVYDSF